MNHRHILVIILIFLSGILFSQRLKTQKKSRSNVEKFILAPFPDGFVQCGGQIPLAKGWKHGTN